MIGARNVEQLHPAYFAIVMSTGIISIAFNGLGFAEIALALFALNIVLYAALIVLSVMRLVFFPRALVQDLLSPQRCWGFLTFVVGTHTVGSQFLVFSGQVLIAQILWVVGLVSWIGFVYLIYINLFINFNGPIEKVISGATLLTVVSTQSVAVLGSQIAHTFGVFSGIVELFALTHFAAGWVLYLILIVLVTYRLLILPLKPEDWTGPYWICMGAVAITTLAGSNILLNLDNGQLSGPILAFTYVAWAIGAWWIPIQIGLDIWKFTRIRISGKVPWWIAVFPWLRLGFGSGPQHFYEPLSWGRVFPMGMFTAATIALTSASNFEVLFLIPSIWGWFALVVWALTFVGTLRAVAQTYLSNEEGVNP